MDATQKRPKLGSKATKSIFIGYSKQSKASRFLNLNSNSIFEATHAIYFEHLTIKDANSHELEKDLIDKVNKDQLMDIHNNRENTSNVVNKEDTNNSNELRRSKRQRIEKDLGPGMFTYLLEEDPKTFNEAMSLPDSNL